MRRLISQLLKDFSIHNNRLVHKREGIIGPSSAFRSKEQQISVLADFLYQNYYSGKGAGSKNNNVTGNFKDHRFEASLAALFRDARYPSQGWEVKEVSDEQTVWVKRNGIKVCLNPEWHLLESDRGSLKPGDIVRVLFSCHYSNISPGFYLYNAEAGEPVGKLVRVYFNLKRNRGIAFTENILAELNSRKLFFQYKIIKSLAIAPRCRYDSAVLYLPTDVFVKEYAYLHSLFMSRAFDFNRGNSPFHYKLFAGVGLAEEPLEKDRVESFGQNRCRLISKSFYSSIKVTGELNREYIFKFFDKQGIDVDSVYLNPSSSIKGFLEDRIGSLVFQ